MTTNPRPTPTRRRSRTLKVLLALVVAAYDVLGDAAHHRGVALGIHPVGPDLLTDARIELVEQLVAQAASVEATVSVSSIPESTRSVPSARSREEAIPRP